MTTRQLLLPPEYNMLTNPGFEHKERPFAVGGSSGYTLDGWKVNANIQGQTFVVTQIASTVGSAGYSAQLAFTTAAGAVSDIAQPLETVAQLGGRVLSFAVTVKCNVANAAHLYLFDGVSIAFSSYHPGGGVAARLAVTMQMDPFASPVWVGVRCDAASCTVEVNDATCVVGDRPAEYTPLPAADDQERCQRYYERHGQGGLGMLAQGYMNAGNFAGYWHAFATTKSGTPSLTQTGTWVVQLCAQPTADFPTADGYMSRAVINTTGNYWFYSSDYATQYIAAEYAL